MGIVGRGRIVTEERVELCGVRVVWHVLVFKDEALGRAREVGRSMDRAHAKAMKARWEKVTCQMFNPAPVKYSGSGMNGARRRKMPGGHDPQAAARMMKAKVSST